MATPRTILPAGWGILALLLLAVPAVGQTSDHAPPQLLAEAFAAARDIPQAGFGVAWGKPLALVRLADTMRLHGMQSEARAVLGEACRSNAEVAVEECRDQIYIELCRLLVLVGQAAAADELAPLAKFRNYSVPARMMIARAAVESGDRSLALRTLRHPSFLQPDADGKGGGDLWRRAAVALAVELDQRDLAQQLLDAITLPLWKSAALGDLAVAQAVGGQAAAALQTVAAAPDRYLTVIGLARVAEALVQRDPNASLDGCLDALRQAAVAVSNPVERDYALGVAVTRLAGAGRTEAAAAIAAALQNPLARVRAQCDLLSPDRLPLLREAVAACPEADRPLLEELVALSCAQHALPAEAQRATERISRPWQRCRTQGAAARLLAERGQREAAAKLAQAAAATAASVEPTSWRVPAHVRAALDAHSVGQTDLADQQFRRACDAWADVNDPELQPGLVAAVAEALAATQRNAALREFAAQVLQADPAPPVRDRLLPVLALAGQTDLIPAEWSRTAPLTGAAQRSIVYRLAQRGETEKARALADKMPGARRVEAFTDIAMAQVRRPPSPRKSRPVGVALNGGWASWFPRLERMGLPWELMPVSVPYELPAAHLAARYRAVGYPGAGGHEVFTGVAGMENLRDYLYAGGGYVGICAGQYLATGQHYVACDSLNMGCPSGSPHQVQMRSSHLVCLGLPPVITIGRRNGGILIPRPGCDVLGWYDTVERYAALAAQEYGFGRVVVLSPHPEGAGGLDARDRLCINALQWVLRGVP